MTPGSARSTHCQNLPGGLKQSPMPTPAPSPLDWGQPLDARLYSCRHPSSSFKQMRHNKDIDFFPCFFVPPAMAAVAHTGQPQGGIWARLATSGGLDHYLVQSPTVNFFKYRYNRHAKPGTEFVCRAARWLVMIVLHCDGYLALRPESPTAESSGLRSMTSTGRVRRERSLPGAS